MAVSSEKTIITTVKTWLFPTVFTMFSYMLYDDIKEIKADVKTLLTQVASDHTEVLNLKESILHLNNRVFSLNVPVNNNNLPLFPITEEKTLATLPQNNDDIKKKNI